jgi:hypothetical protein
MFTSSQTWVKYNLVDEPMGLGLSEHRLSNMSCRNRSILRMFDSFAFLPIIFPFRKLFGAVFINTF